MTDLTAAVVEAARAWVLRIHSHPNAWADETDFALIDAVRSLPDPGCTEPDARWCPTHGDCTCPHEIDGSWPRERLYRPTCPLHGPASNHARPR